MEFRYKKTRAPFVRHPLRLGDKFLYSAVVQFDATMVNLRLAKMQARLHGRAGQKQVTLVNTKNPTRHPPLRHKV